MKKCIIILTTLPENSIKMNLSILPQKPAWAIWDDLIIISDSESYMQDEPLEIYEKTLALNGWYGCNVDGMATHIKKKVIAWDKLFHEIVTRNLLSKYDQFLIVEDDVFFPYHWVSGIEKLFKIAEENQTDALLPRITAVIEENTTRDLFLRIPHFANTREVFDGNVYHCMTSACVLSKTLIQEIIAFGDLYGRFFHIESMIPSIAYAMPDSKVMHPPQLYTIFAQAPWGLDNFLKHPEFFFHPVKQDHNRIRKCLEVLKMNGYEPADSLPDHIRQMIAGEVDTNSVANES